jgi:ABC-type amino acid transport substrate-binding protein
LPEFLQYSVSSCILAFVVPERKWLEGGKSPMKRASGALLASLWLIPVFILVCGLLTGCGGGSSEPEATEAPVAVGTVRVGVSPDWEPWEFIDPETQELAGFDIDLMNIIAEEAEFDVEFVQVPFDSLLAGLGEEYEVAISALLVTEERTADMAFSDAYVKPGLVLVVPSWNRAVWGISDVAGKKAGAIAGSRGADEIRAVDPGALVPFEDLESMFAALAAEERTLDVIVTDYLTATEYMAKTPGVLKSTSPFTTESMGIAVDPSRTDILAAINRGLNLADDHYLLKNVIIDWLAVAPEDRPGGFVLNGGR